MAAEPIERTEGAPGHVAETAPPRPAPPPHRPAPPAAGGSKLPMVLTGLVVLAAAGFGVYWFALRDTAEAGETPAGAAAGEEDEAATGGEKLVEVTHPTQGGLERVTTQPGTVLPYEAADLYAKISGYLKVLNVDIGDRVEQGDLLAVIDDPEALKAVDQRQAALEQAKAAVETSKARIETAKADLEAAQASLAKAAGRRRRDDRHPHLPRERAGRGSRTSSPAKPSRTSCSTRSRSSTPRPWPPRTPPRPTSCTPRP